MRDAALSSTLVHFFPYSGFESGNSLSTCGDKAAYVYPPQTPTWWEPCALGHPFFYLLPSPFFFKKKNLYRSLSLLSLLIAYIALHYINHIQILGTSLNIHLRNWWFPNRYTLNFIMDMSGQWTEKLL